MSVEEGRWWSLAALSVALSRLVVTTRTVDPCIVRTTYRYSSVVSLVTLDNTMTLDIAPKKSDDAKGVLRWAALFLGELRDGLTMVRKKK